jgi:hypothetical protein
LSCGGGGGVGFRLGEARIQRPGGKGAIGAQTVIGHIRTNPSRDPDGGRCRDAPKIERFSSSEKRFKESQL